MIINHRVAKHTAQKSYATEEAAIKAVEKLFGSAEGVGSDYDLIVIVIDGRHVPVVKWNHKNQYRCHDSAVKGFYSTI